MVSFRHSAPSVHSDAAVKVITKLYTFLTNRPAAGQSHDEVSKLDEGDRIPCYKKLTASRMLKQSTVHTIADEEKNLKQTANLLKAYEAKKREEIRAKIEEKNTLYYLPRAAQTNDEFSEGQQRVKTRKKDYPGATEKTSWLSSLKIGIDTLTAMASAHQQNTNRTPDPDSLLLPAGSVEVRVRLNTREDGSRESSQIEVKESARNAQKDEEKVEDIGTLKQRLVELLYLHLYDGGADVEDELQRLLCQIDSKGSREQSASARRIIASFRDSDADHLAVANAVKTDKKIPET
ncbi:hypothetical protein TGGT1_281560 [Toxoplasma gondii GT1]|uniref:Uncharacterized protein n=2 Tax=Toxoplasma gondii TaxID=5811 RepID=S7WB95_TOXGG|nr:hypothetical protein TGGT1_281560 [Toxoplasma gondii GT1]KAF4643049.1 hypothetical protein TGRH88_037780 [Toxoplasma gondii]